MSTKSGVGPQYEQSIKQRVKHPDIRNVVDTKHHTHKNKDKIQKSKKTEETEEMKDASYHLNKVLEELVDEDFKTEEFLAPWKQEAAFPGEFGKHPQDFKNAIEQQLNYYPMEESQYIPEATTTPGSGALLDAVRKIEDISTLRSIFTKMMQGQYESTEPPQKGKWQQPSSVEEIEFLDEDEGEPLELDIRSRSIRAGYKNRNKKIVFGNGPAFAAFTAETTAQKMAGLEVFKKIEDKEALYFPFGGSDSVTFHMGAVAFPIDIIFLAPKTNTLHLESDPNKVLEVQKIVHAAQPGCHDYWSCPKTAGVIEVNAGMCAKLGIQEGATCCIVERVEI
jgi:uncharacterized membrane protein (UPF0127 family)